MPEPAKVVTTDAEIDAVIRRAAAFTKYDHGVVQAAYLPRTDRIRLYLDNGVTQNIPRKLLQGLSEAPASAAGTPELLGGGTGLYWPDLDVAHSVSGLLAGVYGSANWMQRLDLARKRIPA